MTSAQFRKLALSFPEAEEKVHMGHPDFRVCNKIFATLWPDNKWGMVKLVPEQQAGFIRKHPSVFQPIPGGWGKRGATHVKLSAATVAVVRPAMEAAWRNTAPKKLLAQVDAD